MAERDTLDSFRIRSTLQGKLPKCVQAARMQERMTENVMVMDSATRRLSGVQSAAAAQDEYARMLAPGERVEHVYQLNRDHFVFTDRRLILVDQQGITATKFKYHSVPYRSITHFAVETEGSFELDAELRIWISSLPTPIQKQFNRHLDVYEVQAVLASYVLR